MVYFQTKVELTVPERNAMYLLNTRTIELQVSLKVILHTRATLSTFAAALNFRTQFLSLICWLSGAVLPRLPRLLLRFCRQVQKYLCRRITHAWHISSPSMAYDKLASTARAWLTGGLQADKLRPIRTSEDHPLYSSGPCPQGGMGETPRCSHCSGRMQCRRHRQPDRA